MDKRRLHHLWTRLRVIKPWYFLVLALASGVVCVLALRANNHHMLELRQAVHAADRDNTDVRKPLGELQAYVTRHMNTDLNTGSTAVYPPIQLKYTYERLVKAQSSQVAAANARLYSAAQAHCERQNSTDFSGRNRVPCIERYVQSHNPKHLPTIQESLYKFAFASPKWSPDLAGWSLALAVVSSLLFIVTFIASRWFRRYVTD